jgi:ankyrin repeat protein
MVKLLVESGAKVDAAVKSGFHEGWTPLHEAVERDRLEVARFLIEKGADVNARAGDEGSALHLACLSRDINVHSMEETVFVSPRWPLVELLVEKGAKLDVKDAQAKTVLEHARDAGHEKLVSYLESAGKKK